MYQISASCLHQDDRRRKTPCENYWYFYLAAPLAHTSRVWITHIRSVDGASRTFAELGRFGISLIVDNTLLTVSHLQRKPETSLWGHLAQFDLRCSSMLIISISRLLQSTNGQYHQCYISTAALSKDAPHMSLVSRLQSRDGGPSTLLLSVLLDLVTEQCHPPRIKGTSFSANYFIASKLTPCDLCVFLIFLKLLYYISHKPQWLMLILSV